MWRLMPESENGRLPHRALADDVLLDTLKDAADKLGYALR
jgi:hypothetical protein